MKKIVFIVVILVVLAGLGYAGYKNFMPGSKNESGGGPPTGAQLCDVNSHSCSVIQKTADSGTLKIIITASGKSVGSLEVDVAAKPGAPKYYMALTDNNGTAVFDGIPAGSYFIYFNGNNFPTQFGDPPTESVNVISGQTVQKNINLISR